MREDIFRNRAKNWDNPSQIMVTGNFVDQICDSVFLYKEDVIAEIGSGTGLVGLRLAELVEKVYMVDTSPSMMKVLGEKVEEASYNNVELILGEFEKSELKSLNAVIAYMSLHHIEDTYEFIQAAWDKLSMNGFVAIGDLITEDGSFHSNNAGVAHFGFDLEELSKKFEDKGFTILRKEIYDSKEKNGIKYPIFILIAQK